MNDHYEEAELFDYLEDPDRFPERRRLETHLARCASCRAMLAELREFDAALSSTALWDYAEAIRRRRETPESLLGAAGRLAHEDEEAEQHLTPILTSPAAFRRANITGSPLMYTAGVVRKLCSVARELRERQPMHALTLADAAVTIGEKLPPAQYPESIVAELRGHAWLERANVLRYLGRYPEALDALDFAERAFGRTPVAAYSQALVDYLRSAVYFKSERFDEAVRLAKQSARVFRQFGEDDRFMHAKMIQAGVLFHRLDPDGALDLFVSLVPVAKRLGDAATLARLYGNIANCHLSRGDRSAASDHFAQALSLYEALHLETEKVRTRWSLGRLLVQAGDIARGVGVLRQARREFDELGMTTDAALVTLEVVEVLLAEGAHREAAELCAGLVESFTRVGMTGNALTALAYLREGVASGSATPILVRHVRAFLEAHPEDDISFSPPLHL